jgi:hypothetical protein
MTIRILPAAALCACTFMLSACAPTAPAPKAADSSVQAQQVFDRTLSSTEREFVPLVAAMPEDKFGFAPTAGKFDGVRTFGQQAKHAAYVLNEVSAVLLGESAPPTAAHENGPDDVAGKDQTLQYVKDAFAHAHKAIATITNDNLLEQTVDPFDPKGKRTRVDSVGIMSSHTFDHYGQMVEYARMNGIVPPASQ